MGGKKIILTPEQLKFINDNFPTMLNKDIAEHLGISIRAVIRFARELGVCKDPEFMSRISREHCKLMEKCNRARGYEIQSAHMHELRRRGYTGQQFTKGQSPDDTFGREKMQAARRKSGERRRELIELERKRVRWGLDQKTRLRVVEPDRKRSAAKHRLRKIYGYVVPKYSQVAYYGSATVRNLALEKRYSDLHRIRFAPLCE